MMPLANFEYASRERMTKNPSVTSQRSKLRILEKCYVSLHIVVGRRRILKGDATYVPPSCNHVSPSVIFKQGDQVPTSYFSFRVAFSLFPSFVSLYHLYRVNWLLTAPAQALCVRRCSMLSLFPLFRPPPVH